MCDHDLDYYDTYQQTLTLEEMIENDMRQQHNGLDGGCSGEDAAVSNNNTWNHPTDTSIDFDASSLLVNPQTGTPILSEENQSAYILINQGIETGGKKYNHISSLSSTPTSLISSSSSSSSSSEDEEDDDDADISTAADEEAFNQEIQSQTSTTQQNGAEKYYPKPIYSYSCLIAIALKNSETGCLPVSEIYNFMTKNYPYFKTAPNGWKNSVRHNLSLSQCFQKVERPSGKQRKGCLWTMNPDRVEKMDDEVFKWSQKDPIGIKQSMAKPEDFGVLEKFCAKHERQMEDIGMELSSQTPAAATTTPQPSPSQVPNTHIYSQNQLRHEIKDEPDSEINLDNSLLDSTYHVDFWGELEQKLEFDIPLTDLPNACTQILVTNSPEQKMMRENAMLSGGFPSTTVKIKLT